MCNRRPRPGDDENDLLEFQKQFLASGSEPSAKVIKCYKKKEHLDAGVKEDFSNLTTESGMPNKHDSKKMLGSHSRNMFGKNEQSSSSTNTGRLVLVMLLYQN